MSKDTTTFYLQAGFVEGIVENKTTFSTLEKAYSSILKNTKEYCIIEWNAIPFILDYKEDLPYLIKSICELLNTILLNTADNTIKFESPNTVFSCIISENINGQIEIQTVFDKVRGAHEKALNTVSNLSIDKKSFLAEWKLLLEQIIKAFHDSGNKIKNKEDLKVISLLTKINDQIPKRASRYQYETRIN